MKPPCLVIDPIGKAQWDQVVDHRDALAVALLWMKPLRVDKGIDTTRDHLQRRQRCRRDAAPYKTRTRKLDVTMLDIAGHLTERRAHTCSALPTRKRGGDKLPVGASARCGVERFARVPPDTRGGHAEGGDVPGDAH